YFRNFLMAFYDVDQNLDAYYWAARRVLGSSTEGNDAFIQLVGGLASASYDFISLDSGLGALLFPAARGDSSDMYVENRSKNVRIRQFISELLKEGTQMQLQASFGGAAEPQIPILQDGLIPSADGLYWVEPALRFKRH